MSKKNPSRLSLRAPLDRLRGMPDPFTLLGLPRRPWLDGRAISQAFRERARQSHPDAAGGDADAFVRLNSAQATLANVAARLRLLAGETEIIPTKPLDVQLGFRVAEVMRRTSALQEKEGTAANVLSRALLANEALVLRRDFEEIIAALEAAEAELDARLRALDARWPDVTGDELGALAGEYVFLTRWKEQARAGELTLRILFGKGGRGT